MTAFEGTRAEEIRDLTRRRVELFGSAGTTGRFAASLKSISEEYLFSAFRAALA